MTAVNDHQDAVYLRPGEVGALGAFIRARAAEHEARFGDEGAERVVAALCGAAYFMEATVEALAKSSLGDHLVMRCQLQWDVMLEMAAPWSDHRDYRPLWSRNSMGCSVTSG
ncbi:hypothetical protein ACFU7Y_36155 [Kitasatospora sp. NPDC057542]|uniref:hypothetical protein n=1 Tax=Kitasatospora sp. NPDC057542 TaxID=3346162 RepID=UPI003698AB7A